MLLKGIDRSMMVVNVGKIVFFFSNLYIFVVKTVMDPKFLLCENREIVYNIVV